ncbi:hypothetical protein [Rochambeau virus]|uniref:Uncharacterized protein n=1 Tax=Rochambeau virus TaxID=380435 RepID=A0A0D3R1W4_9RHAB|nr:hypothetical protein [Rochambeau virus]AJR28507.1 hypothetical protein [Rochambeau virus]
MKVVFIIYTLLFSHLNSSEIFDDEESSCDGNELEKLQCMLDSLNSGGVLESVPQTSTSPQGVGAIISGIEKPSFFLQLFLPFAMAFRDSIV